MKVIESIKKLKSQINELQKQLEIEEFKQKPKFTFTKAEKDIIGKIKKLLGPDIKFHFDPDEWEVEDVAHGVIDCTISDYGEKLKWMKEEIEEQDYSLFECKEAIKAGERAKKQLTTLTNKLKNAKNEYKKVKSDGGKLIDQLKKSLNTRMK